MAFMGGSSMKERLRGIACKRLEVGSSCCNCIQSRIYIAILTATRLPNRYCCIAYAPNLALLLHSERIACPAIALEGLH